MTFALRSISSHLPTMRLYAQTLSVPRRNIPHIQRRELHKFVEKILHTLIGPKLTPAEVKQQISDHQKLWVIHYSVCHHAGAHRHYEQFYAMQLFERPKDFSTQEHYLDLLRKKTEDLSTDQLQELVDLYKFGLEKNDDFFVQGAIQSKLKMYQAHLSARENL